ncbi:SDR family NAD(P)-dependent oxidoreductase [Paraburkholderia sp. BCC1884]|uniref:SDR family NAD(P)-dependent oxidoreductase n=1 Tax=Paraburkholderia sp. BCC1884 TaxID=2562668 RepID=UPI0011830430|nr:SDR family NAD(P)-dependent oxidoreductase [Paraburkholderia sp. BCC1884]
MNILVTGASAGFGEAVSTRLCNEGHRVFATARRVDRLNALAEQCGAQLVPKALDVRDSARVTSLLMEIEQEYGPVDVLVNNAGIALNAEPACDVPLADWEAMVDTNIKGLMYCTHAVLPGMVARNRGWIFNLGSIAGTYPYPGSNVYGATKAFVHQFSLNLRADLVGKQVRVTSIEPGLCGGTEFSVTRFHGDAARAARVYEDATPLTASDIAHIVSWLLALPAHVNVNAIEIMPTSQASGNFAIVRGEG